MMHKFITPKVTLSDVVEPKPSRSTARVIKGALRRAHQDQANISKRAQSLRAN